MLGEAISMLVPQVVGFRLAGELPEGATATDLVLTVTQILRQTGVVGKFVEYFGHGLDGPAARRPGHDREHVARVRRHLRLLPGRRRRRSATCASPVAARSASRWWRRTARRTSSGTTPAEERDLLAGGRARPRRRWSRRSPARADRRTACRCATRSRSFLEALDTLRRRLRERRTTRRWRVVPGQRPDRHTDTRATSRPPPASPCPPSRPGAALAVRPAGVALRDRRRDRRADHGSVVITAITSCTNTSNPAVMVGAGSAGEEARSRKACDAARG